MQQQQNDFQVVIIECCQNCESHQGFSRHSEWKYFEQFNQLKRKIQRFVPNTIVIKNPIPDELIKPLDLKLDRNVYLQKNKNQRIIFPRIGAFQIYIYNVLIFSKLKVNSWPNHYKVLEILNKISDAKQNHLPLDIFSIYNQNLQPTQQNYRSQLRSKSPDVKNSQSPQKKIRIVQKKKKIQSTHEKQKSLSVYQSHRQQKQPMPQRLQPARTIQVKRLQQPRTSSKKKANRYLIQRQAQVKLPSLRQTINFQLIQPSLQQQALSIHSIKSINPNKSLNKISQQFQKDGEMSIIHKKSDSFIPKDQRFDSLEFVNHDQSILEKINQKNTSRFLNHSKQGFNQQLQNQDFEMKWMENKSIQYSQHNIIGVDLMDRSIQYSHDQEQFDDFGVQIDNQSMPKQVTYQYVQTDLLQASMPSEKIKPKPYMLNQSIQADIILKKKCTSLQTQTLIPKFLQTNTNTQQISYVNRGYQYPQQDQQTIKSKVIKQMIDMEFVHLYQKRRNLNIDGIEAFFSVDRFQEEKTKYKWVGKAKNQQSLNQIKHQIIMQACVFAVYNFFGVKTPQKRLSFLPCSNVVGQKINKSASALYHTMTIQNPQIQYLYQFEQLSVQEKTYPLTQQLTFRSSKTKIQLKNWGKFLAIVHFLQDNQVFTSNKPQNCISPSNRFSNIGVVISNQQVKQIYRLDCSSYKLFQSNRIKLQKDKIFVNKGLGFIDTNRLEAAVELEFIAMLNRILSDNTFKDLSKFIHDIFVHRLTHYDQKYNRLLNSIDKIQANNNKSQIQQLKNKQIQQLKHKQTSPKKGIIQTENIIENAKTKDDKLIKNDTKIQIIQIITSFLSKLQNRRCQLQQLLCGKLYTYRTYNSLQASISFTLPTKPILPYSFLYNKQKILIIKDILKQLKNTNNFLLIWGKDGVGKSGLLEEVKKQLDQERKVNVGLVKNIQNVAVNMLIKDGLSQIRKNVLLVDNIDQCTIKTTVNMIKTIDQLAQQSKFDVTYMFIVKDHNIAERLALKISSFLIKSISKQQNFMPLQMLGLTAQQIKQYISTRLPFKNLSQKQTVIQKVLMNLPLTPILHQQYYLSLYCNLIQQLTTQEFMSKYNEKTITRFSLLKKTFEACVMKHETTLKQMGLPYKSIFEDLRQLVFKLFIGPKEFFTQEKKHHLRKNTQLSEFVNQVQDQQTQLIHNFFNKYQEEEFIKNQLQFYPIDLKFCIKMTNQRLVVDDEKETYNLEQLIIKRNKSLFSHAGFFDYMLIQAYSYYIQKGYKNLYISNILQDRKLLELLCQRYQLQGSYSSLLSLIYQSQSLCQFSQQSSTALTILSKMNYNFSNLIFDHCQVPFAQLSCGTFYNCSFRNTNMNKAILYRTAFYNCVFDNANMDQVDLFVRKYLTEFTPMAVAISIDNKLIAVGCGNYLILLTTQHGKQIKRIEAHLDIIKNIKFSQDGKSLVTIADDKTLRTWDLATFKSVVFKLPQKGSITFNHQTQTIATIEGNNLKVWNIKSMANQSLCQGHTGPITTTNFSANGKYVITGSKDKTVRLWSLKGKQLHIYKGHAKDISCCKISATNSIVLSSSKNQLILFHTQSEQIMVKNQYPQQITQICPDLHYKYIAVTFSGQSYIGILNYITLQVKFKLQGHLNKIISIQFDSLYEKLFSLSKDKSIRLWDVRQIMKIEQCYKGHKIASGPIKSLAFNPLSYQYATGYQNGQITIWNDHSNQIIQQLYDHSGEVTKMTYDREGKLYSGGKDGVLRIWNFDKSKQPRRLELFSVGIVEMRINQKNRIIVTTSENNQLVVYDFTGIKLIYSTRDQGRINAVAFHDNDKLIAIGGNQKFIVTYKIQNQGNTIEKIQELGEHSQPITALTYQGQSLLLCALKGGNIVIWNHIKANIVKKIQIPSPITSIIIHMKKYACFSSQDGKIRIINMDQGKQVKSFRYIHPCTSLQIGVNRQNIPLIYAGCKDGNLIKWNLTQLNSQQGTKNITPLGIASSISQSQRKKLLFSRKCLSLDGLLMCQLSGPYQLIIKNLYTHSQQVITLPCPQPIQSLTFDTQQYTRQNKSSIILTQNNKNIILLLKSGQYWSVGSQIFQEGYGEKGREDGDIVYVKDRKQAYFLKKVKGIRKPTQNVLDQDNYS